ncbi:unnamed protein product [Heligmosomoides polygyrus]|uniref:Secreted protein n=1 Tax=Heligmosomoides polygyrus TaxID=6339 RepID=A0A183G588_HELPZ|nr:unnamed protein product [Heligmosomoides polygyrus]
MRGVGSHIDRRTGSGGTAGLRARASVLWLALMLMASAHAMVVRAVLALRQAAVFVACEAVAQQALRSLLNWNCAVGAAWGRVSRRLVVFHQNPYLQAELLEEVDVGLIRLVRLCRP